MTSATFAYDAFGRRTGRTIAGTATGFAYDGANAVQEQVGGSPVANLLTGGLDELFRRTDAAGDRYPLTDALGSVVALADAAGTIQTAYTYEPYGARTASGSPSGNPAGFTGREHDATGLAFYRARYYDPVRGRFLSEDPAGFAAGDPNLYRYVGDDPVDLTDPSGMFPPIIIGIGLACAGGAAFTGATELFRMANERLLGGAPPLGGRKTDWGDVGAAAVGGCAVGGLLEGAGQVLGAIGRALAPGEAETDPDLPCRGAPGTRGPSEERPISHHSGARGEVLLPNGGAGTELRQDDGEGRARPVLHHIGVRRLEPAFWHRPRFPSPGKVPRGLSRRSCFRTSSTSLTTARRAS